MTRWKPHVSSDGRSYSLSHLHPFRFTLELPADGQYSARTVTVHVGFGLHVFTCDFARASERAEEYCDGRERRAFDEVRYHASFQLEALIPTSEMRKCYSAKNANFFTAEIAGAPHGHEYRVFFSVRRHPEEANTVQLIVQSAYFGKTELRPKGRRRKPIGFRVIISNALLGKPLKAPP